MLFLYMEELLEHEERRQVEDYVAAHSEAQELMQLYDPQLTLPKEPPLADHEGRPLSYSGKELLHSSVLAAAQANDDKRTMPVVPLPTGRRINWRRTLSAAACAALLLTIGIELLLHTGSPAPDNGPAIAALRDNMQQPTALQALASAMTEADKQQPLRQEPLPQQETALAMQARSVRHDLNVEEVQALAEALYSARNLPTRHTNSEILLGDDLYPEDISTLLADMQSDGQPSQPFDLSGEVIVVDDLVIYYDSLSPAERLWSSLAANTPEWADWRTRRQSRAQADSALVAQADGNLLQRMARRVGIKKRPNIKTEFNNLGEYLAEVNDLKQSTMKWIADGTDTLGQRFTNFATNSLGDERFAARRKAQTTPTNE